MRKISSKRIDCLDSSVFVGRTIDGKKMVARFDKLSFVSKFSNKNEMIEFFKKLFKLKSNKSYGVISYKLSSKNSGISSMYKSTIEIKDLSKKNIHKNIVVIHFKSRSQNRGPVRIEMSPQHFTSDEITRLFLWLGSECNLGDALYSLLKKAWITNIHYALDVYGMKLRDYFIGFEYVSKGEKWLPDNGMEGIVLGTSNAVASIYEKVDIRNLSKEDLYKESFLELAPGTFCEFLRLEMRLRPKDKSLMLCDIKDTINLLERLSFYDPAFIDDPDLDPLFVNALESMVFPYAIKKHKISNTIANKPVSITRRAAYKRIDKIRKKYSVELFDAVAIWDKLPLLIEKLGILGTPQYWGVILREKRFPNAKKMIL